MRHPTSGADAGESVVPIGRPYPGRGAVVLDPDGSRMPHGGAGELCITGACVARGYLGRAALTAGFGFASERSRRRATRDAGLD